MSPRPEGPSGASRDPPRVFIGSRDYENTDKGTVKLSELAWEAHLLELHR